MIIYNYQQAHFLWASSFIHIDGYDSVMIPKNSNSKISICRRDILSISSQYCHCAIEAIQIFWYYYIINRDLSVSNKEMYCTKQTNATFLLKEALASLSSMFYLS